MASITVTDAEALLSRQDVGPIVQEATRTSAALASFRTVRMGAGLARMPILSAVPTAGWVTTADPDDDVPEAGVKPTSKATWANKELIAEEIAVIIPVHENILADSNFDIAAELRPLVAQEFGRVLDAAVFFGTNKPATWADDAIAVAAAAAGNSYTAGSGTIGDLAEDVNATFALVEEDNFDVNVAYTGRFLRAALRGLRDQNNQPIYLDNIRTDGNTPSIYGQDLFYVLNGGWDAAEATLIAGDRTKAVLGIREDLSVKVLTEATVGGINLAERDMIAFRFKMRVAYALAAKADPAPGDNFPFAILVPAGG